MGIAILDSGIGSHPDLEGRVVVSVDFVDPDGEGDDEYGHGTHVAGIAASSGAAGGVAPAAHLVNLRVLNDEGWGHASTVIDAIEWTIANKDQYAIRVLNLSLGAGVTESYQDDPLGQAVERAVAAGLVVVCSAGNFGKTEDDTPIIGGISSPGNTPSALTVGALNTFDTPVRSDDAVTSYSSRGPAGLVEAGAGSLNVVAALHTAVHGPAAELPAIHIGGEPVEISGIVFFSRLLPVDRLEEDRIPSLNQLWDLVLRHNVALRLRGAPAESITTSAPNPTDSQAILWTNRSVWSDAILWTNGRVSGDAILWTNRSFGQTQFCGRTIASRVTRSSGRTPSSGPIRFRKTRPSYGQTRSFGLTRRSGATQSCGRTAVSQAMRFCGLTTVCDRSA